MIRFDNISCFSLNELLKVNNESEIKTYLNSFVCNKNTEIESYLKNNSLEFNKKHQAMTQLLFDKNKEVIAYFTLLRFNSYLARIVAKHILIYDYMMSPEFENLDPYSSFDSKLLV